MNRGIPRPALTAALLLPLVALTVVRLRHPPSAAASPTRARAPGSALTAVDAAALRHQLAALKGKVAVLNVWATYCEPCVTEFPELVRFERAYRSRGVTVVGLSMDDPRKARQSVPPFLAQQRASFPIYNHEARRSPEGDRGRRQRLGRCHPYDLCLRPLRQPADSIRGCPEV